MTYRPVRIVSGILTAFFLCTAPLAVANEEPARRGVWLREFPPPKFEIPATVRPEPGTFSVSAPVLGILRYDTDLPLHTPTDCDVTVQLRPQPHGYEIIYSIRNRTGVAQPLPTLNLPGHNLGQRITWLDHRFGLEWRELDVTEGNNAFTARNAYPTTLYSPAIIMHDERFAVGVTLRYDMMNYRHPIRAQISRAPRGSLWDTWTTKFFLDGEIEHGRTQHYTLLVKYNLPDDWIHTLAPYRDHLHETWDRVRYRQDMRPVYANQIGDTKLLSPDNPRGMKPNRPDLNGWRTEVDDLLSWAIPSGYQRVMVWTPSGCYLRNYRNNFPPQVMTHWTQPMLSTEMEWRRVAQSGIDLYFWWGRSGQTAAEWDPVQLENFDLGNPAHAQRMRWEWALAAHRGARGMGLDKFTVLPAWDALPWLEYLRNMRPGARFISEPASYDVLHFFHPTFIQGRHLTGPHFLADYLVPGREMWVHLVGEEETLERALEVIGMGMTVITKGKGFTAHDLEEAIRRAQRR